MANSIAAMRAAASVLPNAAKAEASFALIAAMKRVAKGLGVSSAPPAWCWWLLAKAKLGSSSRTAFTVASAATDAPVLDACHASFCTGQLGEAKTGHPSR